MYQSPLKSMHLTNAIKSGESLFENFCTLLQYLEIICFLDAAKFVRHTITRTSMSRGESRSTPRDRNRPVVMVTTTVPPEPGPPPYSYLPPRNEIVNPPPYTTIPLLIIHSNGHILPSNEQCENDQSCCHDNINNVVTNSDNRGHSTRDDDDEGHVGEPRSSQVTWDEILPPEGDGPPPYDSLSVGRIEENTDALLPRRLIAEDTSGEMQMETVPLSDTIA